MAKDYRTIRFTYNTTDESISVKMQNETINRNEISTVRETPTGKRYKIITGGNKTFSYSFNTCDSDVFDFFTNAYEASTNDNYTVTFYHEQADGSFDSYNVIISQPAWQNATIDGSLVLYDNFSIEVAEA